MKINIGVEELYPAYYLTSEDRYISLNCDVPKKKVSKWKRAIELYEKAQAEMSEYYWRSS